MDQVIQRATENDIGLILVPGLDIETSKQAINLANTYKNVYAAVGFHPNDLDSWDNDNSITDLYNLVQHPKVIAIGEIGLDYYRKYTTREKQISALRKQLELAVSVDLPVILHNRDSHDDLFSNISSWCKMLSLTSKLYKYPGVFHSFDGNYDYAMEVINLNFYIGIGGPVTFKNATDKQKLIKKLPLEKLLLETDAPFLSPHPHRGKRNEPSNISIIAQKISEIKNIDKNIVANITTTNSKDLFSWEIVN